MSKRSEEFMAKLHALLEEYKANIYYTNNDDGVHVDVDGEVDVYIGFGLEYN